MHARYGPRGRMTPAEVVSPRRFFFFFTTGRNVTRVTPRVRPRQLKFILHTTVSRRRRTRELLLPLETVETQRPASLSRTSVRALIFYYNVVGSLMSTGAAYRRVRRKISRPPVRCRSNTT